MDVQLRQLRTLVAVADTGTFTEAAAVLGVSQAAVSRTVAALETTLGARLVDRTTRHVALTALGHRAVTTARRILDDVAHLHRLTAAPRPELRVGYHWAALGKHTRPVQRRWAAAHPGVPLVFVQSATPTAGLADGSADVAVLRRPLDTPDPDPRPDPRTGTRTDSWRQPGLDPRLATAVVGHEARRAAVATDNPLARRRSVTLADLARYTVAIDFRTGTTTPGLWPADAAPTTRHTRGLDEWLTLIAAGQAVGLTAEATANQNPRPGVAYRTVRDTPPIPVLLAWWRDDPPEHLPELLHLIRTTYLPA
ncbi:LysR family transcriptional regulator [Spirilliplanes yamanashiensis]|uniref:LysR family transcriptional regulator n=1 Tax=Spirilliplanes yamanashiensis TaxID=42233 RepID=A0A8J4DJZ8_9ACTN|nr:LysR family transcriptional regulator [Spirilliplanes yamanashiensis]MDP9817912.1 DNA-binding transcriptional LysR family regulator [Spirilliplanes yamanashiensis]GIJ04722.1 LysR family transcriptional regulator [Spirilliplanes yamanashiensis]